MASPWIERARARNLPAADRTGRVILPGPTERAIERAAGLDILADRITVGPSRGSYTVADLQRAVARESVR